MAASETEKMILIERLDRALEAKNKIVQRAKDDSLVYLHPAETAVAAGVCGTSRGAPVDRISSMASRSTLRSLRAGSGSLGSASRLRGMRTVWGNSPKRKVDAG
jgi:hypothetical protein